MISSLSSERVRGFFLVILFAAIPFSIAGVDFAIIGLYLVTTYRLIRGQDRLFFTPIMVGMGLMLFAVLISALFSGAVLHSLTYFRNFWRLGLPFLILLAFRKRSSDPYIRLLAVIAILIGIYAVVQHFTGLDVLRSAERQAEYRSIGGVWYAVGIFSHHLTFGGVFLLLFAMFLPNGFSPERIATDRILFFIAAAASLAAVVVCMGRSIWLGALTAMAVTAFVFLGRKRSLIVVGLVLVLAGGFYAFQGSGKNSFFRSTEIGRRIMSISYEANIDRIMMWTAAAHAIRDYPLLGLGPKQHDALQTYYDKIRREKGYRYQHKAHVGVHNIYLQNWLNFGFLGLAGYLIWWGTILLQILLSLKNGPITSRVNVQLTGFLAGLSGIMVAGCFENNFRDGEVQTTILTVMGLSLAFLAGKNASGTIRKSGGNEAPATDNPAHQR